MEEYRSFSRWEDNIKMGVDIIIFIDSIRGKDYWKSLLNASLNLRFS